MVGVDRRTMVTPPSFVARILGIAMLAGIWSSTNMAVASPPNRLAALHAVLSTPSSKIDFARAKLTLDKLVDPKIDVEASLREIDGMTARLRAFAGNAATNRQKLNAVRRFIYESGPWNDRRPFSYDRTDPFGRKIGNKLLANYLRTRQGNCVTMPILFLILGNRLGLPVTLSTAPLHIFIKYRDDESGGYVNLETTSGALPARDAWIRRNMPMTDAAIRNGLYMRALDAREALAVMAETVLEDAMRRRQYREAVAIADAMLAADARNVDAILSRGSAYGVLAQTAFVEAEGLGWQRPPGP